MASEGNARTDTRPTRRLCCAVLIWAATASAWSAAWALPFVRVTDATNPIVTDANAGSYTGCAWVDYDSDGRLDLFVVSPGGNQHYERLHGPLSRFGLSSRVDFTLESSQSPRRQGGN